MCNIFEKYIEWNVNLYVSFVDLEKAFDSSVDGSVLWRIMRGYRIPEKMMKVMYNMYSGSECIVTDLSRSMEKSLKRCRNLFT